jgi:hypothetical protein
MVPLTSLLVPIAISAVVVFVASFITHMVMGYHKSDLRKLPDRHEDQILSAVGQLNLQPADYALPHPGSPDAMKDPAFIAKMTKGPLIIMNVSPGAAPSLGTALALWFGYVLVVTFFSAYMTSRAVTDGTDYLTVFRFAGTSAFMGYALGQIPESIWYRRSWVRTFKSIADSLLYALLTAGVFGWLWPGR